MSGYSKYTFLNTAFLNSSSWIVIPGNICWLIYHFHSHEQWNAWWIKRAYSRYYIPALSSDCTAELNIPKLEAKPEYHFFFQEKYFWSMLWALKPVVFSKYVHKCVCKKKMKIENQTGGTVREMRRSPTPKCLSCCSYYLLHAWVMRKDKHTYGQTDTDTGTESLWNIQGLLVS